MSVCVRLHMYMRESLCVCVCLPALVHAHMYNTHKGTHTHRHTMSGMKMIITNQVHGASHRFKNAKICTAVFCYHSDICITTYFAKAAV